MFTTEKLTYSNRSSDTLAKKIGYYSIRISFMAIRKQEWKPGEGLQVSLNGKNIDPLPKVYSIPFEGDCGNEFIFL